METHLLDAAIGKTWVFTGGEFAEGGFALNGAFRNSAGLFEEVIRWDLGCASVAGRERFVFNTARTGLSVREILQEFPARIGGYHPAAVVYLSGREDEALEKGEYQEGLRTLEKKVKDLGAEWFLLKGETDPLEAANRLLRSIGAPDSKVTEEERKRWRLRKATASETRELLEPTFACHEEVGSGENAEMKMEQTAVSDGKKADAPKYRQAFRPDSKLAAESEVEQAAVSGDGLKSGSENWDKALSWQRNRLRERVFQEKKPMKWLFIGDSITHGALHTYGYDSFPQLWEKYLRRDLGRQDDVVLNTAVSGATAKEFLERLKIRYTPYRDADVVVAMFGTNDCCFPGVIDEDSFREQLGRIINLARGQGSQIILQVPQPQKKEAGARKQALEPFAQAVREVAEEKKVILVDHFKTFSDWEKNDPERFEAYMNDAIHPGARGHYQMFRELAYGTGLVKDGEDSMASLMLEKAVPN